MIFVCATHIKRNLENIWPTSFLAGGRIYDVKACVFACASHTHCIPLKYVNCTRNSIKTNRIKTDGSGTCNKSMCQFRAKSTIYVEFIIEFYGCRLFPATLLSKMPKAESYLKMKWSKGSPLL